ncbi:MAG: hypothetical protein MZV70_64175 [Desulfobacterales bacterium]|nr:hypothetical protein [Desulfobacterales bacterium]
MEDDSNDELSEWKEDSGTEHKPRGSGRRRPNWDERDSEDDEWSERMEDDSDDELSEWKEDSGTEHKPRGQWAQATQSA